MITTYWGLLQASSSLQVFHTPKVHSANDKKIKQTPRNGQVRQATGLELTEKFSGCQNL